jgi:hypothetical protein
LWLVEEVGASFPTRRPELQVIVVFISIGLFCFPLFCLLSLSFSLKAVDVTTADSCFFLLFRTEQSLWDVITGTGDSSSNDIAVDEGVGESVPFGAGYNFILENIIC